MVFKDLRPGEYAVAAYQDLDGNHKLNRSFIGIPSEPNGMSNGAKGRFGPAKWENAKFSLSAQQAIVVKLE